MAEMLFNDDDGESWECCLKSTMKWAAAYLNRPLAIATKLNLATQGDESLTATQRPEQIKPQRALETPSPRAIHPMAALAALCFLLMETRVRVLFDLAGYHLSLCGHILFHFCCRYSDFEFCA